jgi:subtilisin family serine protease
VDLSAYLPGFAAPSPVDALVLTTGFTFLPSLAQDVANLLDNPEYLNSNVSIAWLQDNFDANVPDTATQDPLRSSGAVVAHAAGLTGAGEIIAMSDSVVAGTHESLSGRMFVFSTSALDDDHGTAVASVMAGNSADFIGTAPGASVFVGDFLDDTALAAMGQLALDNNAVAWNNSWNFPSLGVDSASFDSVFNYGQPGLDYLASLDAYAAKGVVVFAVSNDSLTGATIMDGLPWLRNSLEAGWIAVANGVPTLNGKNVTGVHLLSNACWEAARWCLVADGTWTAATGSGSDYAPVTGSSFAAPQVSGAMALLAEAFPDLTPHELRVRLLASADMFFTPDATVQLADGFSKGYSVTFGHGFLDIEAALKPIGGTVMTLSEGRQIDTDAPVLRTGSAMGDAVERSLAGKSVAVRDALSAGFLMPADALTAGARPASQAMELLAKSLQTDLAATRLAEPAALAEPFAAFSGPVMTLGTPDGAAQAAILLPGSEGEGLAVSRALTEGATRIDLGLKLARDDGQLMGLDGASAATMTSVTLGITQDLGGGGFLALAGEMGVTDLGGSTAFGRAGSARFDAVKLTVGQSGIFTRGDRITLGVGLPVAIASGETVLDLPVMREGAAAFEAVSVDLAPEDRQIDLELAYQTALNDGMEMKLSLIHSENFGNRAGSTDTGGALAFAFRF